MPTPLPRKNEISAASRGDKQNQNFINGMLQNDDTVLQRLGGDLDIYKELARDDQVTSTFSQRRAAVVSTEYVVEPASDSAIDIEAADFIREQLINVNIDKKTDMMLWAVFYGWSVAELMYKSDGERILLDDIKVRDRARFGFGLNDRLMLDDNGVAAKAEPMPANKFWVAKFGADNDDQPYGLGLCHALYWLVFFKRNDIKFWLVYLEKLGVPSILARMPPGKSEDEAERQAALGVVDAIQNDAGTTAPDDLILEVFESAKSGRGDYSDLAKYLDAGIAKIVLNQTMTTDDGSSQSQATVHQTVRDKLVKSDADMLSETINEQIIKPLIDWNFEGAGYPKFWRKTEPQEDLNSRVERDKGLFEMGYRLTEEAVIKNYGDDYEPLVVAELPGNNANFAESDGTLNRRREVGAADQESLFKASQHVAQKVSPTVQERVQAIADFAEGAGTQEEVESKILEMLAEKPNKETVDSIEKANFFSKLLGITKHGR